MTAPVARLSGVAKTFASGVVGLSPVDLEIQAGSFVAVVGPSGCGKSTLLRLISGLLEPSVGAITREADSAKTGAIGFVFQDPTLMPWATAAENVSLPFRLANVSAADSLSRTASALSLVGLDGFANAYPRELSGGMRMRASIARAIVMRPRLLLMDEPFAALDEFTRFRLNDDLLALWRENRWTVVFVTHSIREAVFLAERVIVLSPRPGRIVADVPVDLPRERTAATRLSHAFSDQCVRVNAAMVAAIGGAA